MPTASQYREAASRYRSMGENYLRQASLVSGWRVAGHLGDGPVAEAVTGALQSSSSHLSAASEEMARLARACDARAAICDDYAQLWRQFLALDPEQRRFTPPPPKPYPWVSPA
jgi:hypothetical protein